MAAGIIVCGIQQGFEHNYRCPYCGHESDDLEDFAISMCWDCIWENKVEEPEDVEEDSGTLAADAPASFLPGDSNLYIEGIGGTNALR